MAWQAHENQRYGKTYRDDQNPNSFSMDLIAARLHYSSTSGAKQYDNKVDFTPERVTAGGYDGWRVQAAPWHYFLGQYPGNTGDGWVGFGPKQGAHQMWFRLVRLGFMLWPTRDWWDIGGAPDYNRANLTEEVRTVALGTIGEQFQASAKNVWANLWTTPGGGICNAEWVANGNGLKEEITLNQEARDWIAANRNPLDQWPGESLSDIYFGFVFELDHAGIPRFVKNGIAQSMTGDWSDDGANDIKLENSLQEFLAFLPIDQVMLRDANEEILESHVLRKRFYSDGGKTYLLVGVRADLLNGMSAGTLIFDPTLDLNEDVTDYSYYILDDDDTIQVFYNTGASHKTGALPSQTPDRYYHQARYFPVDLPYVDMTVTTSYCSVDHTITAGPFTKYDMWFEDAASPSECTTFADFMARTMTTASVNWEPTVPPNAADTPSLNGPIQELMDSYGNLITAFHWFWRFDIGSGYPASDEQYWLWSNDGAESARVQLHIEFTGTHSPNLKVVEKQFVRIV